MPASLTDLTTRSRQRAANSHMRLTARGVTLAWCLLIAILGGYVLLASDSMPWNQATPTLPLCPAGSDTITVEGEYMYCDG